MPTVVFAAPFLSPSAARMVTATASLPGVRLGVVSQDPQEHAPPEVRAAVQVVFVRTVEEALDAAFGPGALAWRHAASVVVESRL